MKISQNLYNNLSKKSFYKYICGNELFDCFCHYGENKYEIIDVEKLEETTVKYKIFRHAIDTLDYEIFKELHRQIHNGGEDYLELTKPTIISNRIMWLDSGVNPNDLIEDNANIESNINWEVKTSN